jgi:hypothetical protein
MPRRTLAFSGLVEDDGQEQKLGSQRNGSQKGDMGV